MCVGGGSRTVQVPLQRQVTGGAGRVTAFHTANPLPSPDVEGVGVSVGHPRARSVQVRCVRYCQRSEKPYARAGRRTTPDTSSWACPPHAHWRARARGSRGESAVVARTSDRHPPPPPPRTPPPLRPERRGNITTHPHIGRSASLLPLSDMNRPTVVPSAYPVTWARVQLRSSLQIISGIHRRSEERRHV